MNENRNLDQSVSGASADSSLIKSWISIKDLKVMIQGSKQKDPEKTKNLPLQINSRKASKQQLDIQDLSSEQVASLNSVIVDQYK